MYTNSKEELKLTLLDIRICSEALPCAGISVSDRIVLVSSVGSGSDPGSELVNKSALKHIYIYVRVMRYLSSHI